MCGAALVLGTAAHPCRADDELSIAELRQRINQAYTPEVLRGIALALSSRPEPEAVTALEEIMAQCDAFETGERGRVSQGTIDITRAYALYALGVVAKTQRSAHGVIQDNFRIAQPIGVALLKARYVRLPELIERHVTTLLGSGRAADQAPEEDRQLPGVSFTRASYTSGLRPAPDAGLVAEARDAAVILEWSRSRGALPLMLKLLSHPGDPLWRKRVYRALMSMKAPDSTKLGVLREQLKQVRGDESDRCRWDMRRPESVRFAIDTISAEAYLVLALWRLDIPLRSKAALSLPSLESPSFTARAAAIDRLAGAPQSAQLLMRAVSHADDDTRHFMALRLEHETNDAARAVLMELSKDSSPDVAATARQALAQF
jgi:hypothetical protein